MPQLFWEADAKAERHAEFQREIGAQEAGIVSRRAEEPSDADVGLISGNMEKGEEESDDKKREWKAALRKSQAADAELQGRGASRNKSS